MKRNKHQLSHYKLLTGDLGKLYPCGVTEILPGDTVEQSTNALIRLSPLAAPTMHPITVRIHHFFVPHRLSWDEAAASGTFEDFITGGKDGKDTSTVPTATTNDFLGNCQDYLGLPRVAGIEVNSMPQRCYNMIFNEFYRDQDLVDEVALNGTAIQQIAWEKDYFTTSRPWPQKGDAVTLPIGTVAPVKGLGKGSIVYDEIDTPVFETGESGLTNYAKSILIDGNAANDRVHLEEDPNNEGFPGIYADLSEATGVNINEVRKAFALQRFAEARARYGSRYTEYLRYSFGVKSSDARLQRPEYLGGGRVNVSISEVLQTAPDDSGPSSSFVGDLYGHGIAAMRSNRYRRHFNEHGYIMSLLSVRPKALYQDGVPRHYLRRFREDFFQKELQHIGQQEVYNNEVFARPDVDGDGYGTWGYGDRYKEYRYQQSQAVGEFRELLDYWHLGRSFSDHPPLNQSFTDCVPSKRIFSEQTNHSMWMLVQHRIVARRMVSQSAQSRIM